MIINTCAVFYKDKVQACYIQTREMEEGLVPLCMYVIALPPILEMLWAERVGRKLVNYFTLLQDTGLIIL